MSDEKNTLSAYELYKMFVDYFEENYDIDTSRSLYDSSPTSKTRTAILAIPLSGESQLEIAFRVNNNLEAALFHIRTPRFTEKNFLINDTFFIGHCSEIKYPDETAYGIVKNFLLEVFTNSNILLLHAQETPVEWDEEEKQWTYRIGLATPTRCSQDEFSEILPSIKRIVDSLTCVWEEAIENFKEFRTNRNNATSKFIDTIKYDALSRYKALSNS